ncbi:hypothetical protein [Sporosarcina sp. 6E9]|uniref:hypothetical protein n=1 Tax=Sporosarcina sp. 6E9 TaxID=2819235 RepID=UPI001B315EE6|nr:hypothetical protein [Sporosarcina sp. 6E9]
MRNKRPRKCTKVEKILDDNNTVYYVENVDEYHADDGSVDRIFYFYRFITDNNSKQALYDFEEEMQMGFKIMNSVEFK